MIIKFKKLHPDAIIPQYQTEGAAGFDLHAIEDKTIYNWKGTCLIKTGLSVEFSSEITIRDLFHFKIEMQIRPRSSLSKKGVIIPNSPGTIDADYRGEIMVPLYLLYSQYNAYSFEIKKGDRIAQAVINTILKPEIVEASELSKTNRGSGGFGSTGR